MYLSRRKFTQVSLLTGASFATSVSFFFPKPVEAFSLDFLIKDASVDNVFTGLIAFAGIKIIDSLFPSTQPPAITVAENKFDQKGFNKAKTPYGRIKDDSVIWGQEKIETDPLIKSNVPNPGFAIAEEDNPEPILFTASTTVGIRTAMKVLKKEYKFSTNQINEILIPAREDFTDITTWQGDRDPAIGNNPNVGFTSYVAQNADVLRRYERLNSKLGQITMNINSPICKTNITTNVKFA